MPGLKRDKKPDEYAKFCNAYINGWNDARVAFLQGTRTFCPPNVTVKDMSVVFFDYMAEHKEARDMPAAQALMQAFKDKFPCQEPSTASHGTFSKVQIDDFPNEVGQIAKDVAAACKQADEDGTSGDLNKTISVYERGDGKRLAVFDPSKICTFRGNGACSTGGCDFYVYSEQAPGGVWKKEFDQTAFDKRVAEGRPGQTPLKMFIEVRGDMPPCNRKRKEATCNFEVTWRGTSFDWKLLR
ncbi:hypothetical protein BST65_20695 [Bradyrhizobium canariense]|nr:hypothetical protein BST65_20695 [Bradyrhizobium canariense]OSI31012.1 hypothetical protein BST66_21150 [Bradyrhizobium canariense]OSI39917.1 hypothetical protein BSZ20_28700 [Bradyrhizobium canariense]OSI48207.1 hypothetical protein BST67_19180 [Bradyrhizobium canariense]OSI50092.1 hypothetical protein BSZ15_34035 [Bradyrhizobium canariense]